MAWPVMLTPAKYLDCGGDELTDDLAPVRELIRQGVPEGEALGRVAADYEREARASGFILDTRRGTMADVLRRYLSGPDVCVECGSPVAMRNLCAPCEAGVE